MVLSSGGVYNGGVRCGMLLLIIAPRPITTPPTSRYPLKSPSSVFVQSAENGGPEQEALLRSVAEVF